jgi:hypothetical protein
MKNVSSIVFFSLLWILIYFSVPNFFSIYKSFLITEDIIPIIMHADIPHKTRMNPKIINNDFKIIVSLPPFFI